jgi:hypothetical protein
VAAVGGAAVGRATGAAQPMTNKASTMASAVKLKKLRYLIPSPPRKGKNSGFHNANGSRMLHLLPTRMKKVIIFS